jgi:RimJ/RimL family protein N-acetyltransferase
MPADIHEPLDTTRLRIRRLTAGDAPFILELLNDPAFLRYIGDRNVRSLDDARKYIADGPVASHATLGFGLDLVVRKAGDVPIGICGLLKRDALPDPDIGFAYLAPYCGAGYGQEAAARCLQHARDVLGLPRVLAITSPDNTASIHLLEKLGFAFERLTAMPPGAHDVKLFSKSLR